MYKTNNYIYDFQQFETIRSFCDIIYSGKIIIDEPEMDQSNLLKNMAEFNNKTRPKRKKDMEKKTFDSVSALYEGGKLTLNAFKSGIFPIKATKAKGRLSDLAPMAKVSDRKDFDCARLKILTPK